MRRLFFWGTLIAGATAAYLMYRRGESLGTIAARTVTSPIGTLATELTNNFSQTSHPTGA
jgi:hypothetical protein